MEIGATSDRAAGSAEPADGSPVSLTEADFHPSVAGHHRRIDAALWDDIYVVGDVHGCIDELRRLMDVLDPSADDLVVFVGDLVRKGPDTAAVVEYVRSRDNLVSVRGNNEHKLIHDRKQVASLGPADETYLESLPVALSWDGALVVHGGVDPSCPLTDQDAESLLNCRSPGGEGYDGPFWFETYRRQPRVFFGHTVLEAPVRTEWAVGLDTGCVYGGSLTAYDYRRDRFVSVPATETYEERADRKVLAPDDVNA
ncbi:metallophosphoesterase family protein [Halobellus clavatus]|jgi:serine/threonine protein phosphatase 1|uniref:Serine/threonine protein phosphatase 1 n=1 Tax=Halobellus clavatus TaxID=660517 RepID=A0A1H3EXI6_9EURY|nr:metallophosphoesterase family protein [Halobellus clavatus]SDX83486.1 serine/threonine protein phosphatase 1 [Halobellus clavatus]